MLRKPAFTVVVIMLAVFVLAVAPLSIGYAQPQTPPRPPRDLDTGLLSIDRAPANGADGLAPLTSGALSALQVNGMAAWSKLTYQSYIGNWDIFAANGDGANPVRLTSAGEPDITPRFNRGATRIAFVSNEPGNYEILAMNTDGSHRVRLTNQAANDYGPAWSPDGSKIVFNSYRDGQSEIYVMNADGSNPARITNDGSYDGQPVWSPDGTKIAFLSDRSGGDQIWVMNADGSGATPLTTQPYSEDPAWSPDGTQVAYDADTDGDGWQELMIINADGTSPRVIADTGTAADLWARSWSPDGRSVAATAIYYVYYYYQGNWYWTAAYSIAVDTVTGGAYSLGGSDTDWLPDWQTTDLLPPTSSMTALPATSPSPMAVKWSGVDAGPSGILGYDVQVKDGAAGTWTTWLARTSATSGAYPGVGGHTYYFRTRAWDQSNNAEAWPSGADASTTVEALPPLSAISPLPSLYRGSLLVRWNGNDPGSSGIQSYDIQYRDGLAGAWTDWQMGASATSKSFTGAAGHTYYFRSRAIDRAQNQENWPSGDGKFSTQYAWLLAGLVADNRGIPVVGVSVTTTPPALATFSSNASATYRAYGAADAAVYSATWQNASYGPLPETNFSFDSLQDAQLDTVLPPSDNVVVNSGFETGAFESADWFASGALTPTIIDNMKHTGRYSARLGNVPFQFAPALNLNSLGAASQSPQLSIDVNQRVHLIWQTAGHFYYRGRDERGLWSTAEDLTSTGIPNTARVVVDQTGVLHAMWADYSNIYYKQRSQSGVWSNQQTLPSTTWAGRSLQIFIDDSGQVHAVWEGVRYAGIEIFYAYRNTQGVWSAPQSISVSCQHARIPQLAVDRYRQVHIVYLCASYTTGYDEVAYRMRDSGGQWSGWATVSRDPYASQFPSMAVDAQGVVHVVWQTWYGWSIWNYAQRSSDGVWSSPLQLAGTSRASEMQMMLDSHGLARLAWVSDGDIFFAQQRSNGTWSDPLNLPFSGGAHQLRIAPGMADEIHLIWSAMISPTQDVFFYTHCGADGVWSPPQKLSNGVNASGDRTMAVDQNGDAHVAWVEGSSSEIVYYAGPVLAAESSDSSIAQAVTIPVTLDMPTLSLLYHLDVISPFPGTWLSAQVDDGSHATTVISDSAYNGYWQQRWVDVSAWTGRAITVTINLHQTAGNPATRVYLDDITLGSWLTPDPQAVAPAHITVPAAQVITITGDNFIAPTQVRLNDTPLPDVTWINTTTLTATVPALPFGRYDLIVTNPGGQASGLPRALLVGYEVLLPVVRK